MSESLPPGPFDRPLELSPEAFRQLADQATERLVGYLASLDTQPAAGLGGGKELAEALVEEVPDGGASFEELLDLLFERAIPVSFNTAGPGYLAFIPGGGVPHAGVADLISSTVNRYIGAWLPAPGLVQLETNVIRWFCDFVGLPAGSGGVLTSGGSIANLTAVVTARQERLPEDFLAGTIYVSDQAHHSVARAARLAGFPARRVREIPCDDHFRVRLDVLRHEIAEDRQRGLQPFLLVANAGSTNTGAVDDLEAMADLAAEEELWLHVDAAYGGFFVMTDRGKATLRGIERADSLTLDPHKGLFMPYGTGCLLVRDLATLHRAHSARADYLPTLRDDLEQIDFCEISPELSRDFRGLRIWLPFRMHGAGAFRRQLDEKLDLAAWATDEMRQVPELEILAEPQLSLVVFRLHPKGCTAEELDRLNRDFIDRINRRQRVMLTGTILPGIGFALRICVLSFRTHRERMEMGMQDLRRAAEEALAGLQTVGM